MPEYLLSSNWLKEIKDKNIFLFLDFDGTLTPIIKDPTKSLVSDELLLVLKNLASKINIGIISGRDLEDLNKRVPLKNLYLSGSHGIEIKGPSLHFIYPLAKSYKNLLDEIFSKVEKKIKFKGVILEKKKFSFAFHFRGVDKTKRSAVKKNFSQVITNFLDNRIKIQKGKMVIEVLPSIDWNKGEAIIYLQEKLDKSSLPIYLGDDLTDETAFRVLKDRGVTIRIGYSNRSAAKFYLKSQKEVFKLIKLLSGLYQ